MLTSAFKRILDPSREGFRASLMSFAPPLFENPGSAPDEHATTVECYIDKPFILSANKTLLHLPEDTVTSGKAKLNVDTH